MLSYGFKDQIYDIFTHLPIEIQVGLFSATLPPDVLELSKKFMRKPIRILVKKDQLTLEGIKQFYIDLRRDEWKFDTLLDIYKTLTLAQTILYVNTRNKCEWLSRKLREKGYSVSAMHGSMGSDERKQIMDNFRRGDSRFGRKGVAINFCTDEDMGRMESLKKYYSTQVDELPDNISELI